ncbi:allergen asp f 4, partial [Colletotrichum asianum]
VAGVVALAADTVLGLHAGHVGALVGAVGLDPRAGLVVGGDLHAVVAHAGSSSDEDGGIGTGVAAVGGGAPVELEPGAGELADEGLGDLGAGAAGTRTLGVGLEGDVLVGALLDGEGDGGEPGAVDQALGADLVEAGAGEAVLGGGEGGGVVVQAQGVFVDDLHVAAPVAVGAGVAGVGDLLDGGALGLAGAEGGVDAGAGGGAGGGGGGRGGGDVLDEGRVALLDGVDGAALVEVLVAVEGGVGGGGGREEDEVVDELHLEGGFVFTVACFGRMSS